MEDKSIQYKEKLVQSLMLAHYTDGGPFLAQALVHYVAMEYFDCKDANSGVWIIAGILVGVATYVILFFVVLRIIRALGFPLDTER
jgi:hypothetical protein